MTVLNCRKVFAAAVAIMLDCSDFRQTFQPQLLCFLTLSSLVNLVNSCQIQLRQLLTFCSSIIDSLIRGSLSVNSRIIFKSVQKYFSRSAERLLAVFFVTDSFGLVDRDYV